MIFVVIGLTGSGKTSFINALDGRSGNEEASCLNPVIQNPTPHTIQHDGQHLVFLDTPGLDHPQMPDAGIFGLVARWLDDNYRPGIEIGIIYLHRIINNRIRGTPHEHIETFRKRCSGMAVRQICLVTTMWDEIGISDIAMAEMQERSLQEGFEKQYIPVLFKRLDNQRSSAWDTVNELIRDRPASNHRTLDNMIYVVIGPIGSGKTSFIKALVGRSEDEETARLNPVIQNPTPHKVEHGGRRFVFLDTPGLDNPHMPDAGILGLVARWLDDNYRPDIEIGIIYLHRIINNRIRGTPHEHIGMLRKRCSGVAVSQICLVTTMWDEIGINDTATAEMQERLLEGEFKKQTIRLLFKRLDNQRSSACDIVSELIGGEACRLQEELEDRERRSNGPETGRASYNRLQMLLSQRREVLQQLLARAATEADVSGVQDLQADIGLLDAQIRRTFEEVRQRNTSIMRRVLRWLARKPGTTASVPSSSSTASHRPEASFSQYY